MKVKINHILVLIMSFLGFSCTKLPWIGRCEYGTPNADFSVKGRVTDEAGKPIKGIKVTPLEGAVNYPIDYCSVTTDADGKFSNEFNSWPSKEIRIAFDDVDGEENGGKFVSDTVTVEFSKKLKKGSGNWYEGKFAPAKDVIVKLKKN